MMDTVLCVILVGFLKIYLHLLPQAVIQTQVLSKDPSRTVVPLTTIMDLDVHVFVLPTPISKMPLHCSCRQQPSELRRRESSMRLKLAFTPHVYSNVLLYS